MIDANSKTNSFLEAIEKYAEEQKSMMRAEVEAFREEQLKRANEEGAKAAFSFIQKEKAEFKADLAKENALKETAVKRDLFDKRNNMVNSIFNAASKKLKEYSNSDEYKSYIDKSAKTISEYIGGKSVVIYISPADSKFEETIKNYFVNCEIIQDDSIKLGGIRCYCEELSLIADDTLDSKFENQKSEFISNSGFMIE